MKRSLPRAILLFLLPCVAIAGSRESAFRAQELAGTGVWSQVIRITNAEPRETARLPEEFHGLVVVFADIVWLYTEFDGTQNLSLRRGQTAADLAHLGELLREADPHWVAFEVETERPPPGGGHATPPNSCFLACVAQWQQLQRAKRPPKEARLIACFAPGRVTGHMLLEFRKGWRRYVYDPENPVDSICLGRGIGRDALAVANAVLAPRWKVAPARTSTIDLAPTWRSSPPRVATAHTPDQPRS
jgi:hypothetical protein